MSKPYYKKETIYCVEGEKQADQLRSDLYNTYENVLIYANGLNNYKVVCTIKS